MNWIRMFSNDNWKGKFQYLETQKWYELVRTICYFSISIILYAAGWITTGNRTNLLTIIAILGCLPASHSLVSTIMYFRYKGLPKELYEKIKESAKDLPQLFDLVFTSEQKNYEVYHMVVCENTVCGYTEQKGFDEQKFYNHIDGRLKADHHKNVTVKIFTDFDKYCSRLQQLQGITFNEKVNQNVLSSLKSVSL